MKWFCHCVCDTRRLIWVSNRAQRQACFVRLDGQSKRPFIGGTPNLIMTLAFVFLNCDIGAEKSVLSDMRTISGVSEAVGVAGIYDIVAKLRADSNGEITSILRKFHRITHVRSCSTMIVTEELDNWHSE